MTPPIQNWNFQQYVESPLISVIILSHAWKVISQTVHNGFSWHLYFILAGLWLGKLTFLSNMPVIILFPWYNRWISGHLQYRHDFLEDPGLKTMVGQRITSGRDDHLPAQTFVCRSFLTRHLNRQPEKKNTFSHH